MKVSLILTTKNEESSIEILLESIKSQTRKPDEIVIVDALSKDKTGEIIKNYSKSLPIKLISQKSNRSQGRNLAILNAKNEIIVATDAGSVLDKNWLKNILEPFKNEKIDVVSGFYKPIIKSFLDELVYLYTSVVPEKLNKDTFLPSSRSVAFRKKAWKEVGGYPEFLDSSEDLYFNFQLKKKGFKFFTRPDAIVHWQPRSRNQSIFKQFYVMARSSAYAKIIKKTVYLQLARYILGTAFLLLGFVSAIFWQILALLFLLYCLWTIAKNLPYLKNKQIALLLPPFQILVDLAVISGSIAGTLKRFEKSYA